MVVGELVVRDERDGRLGSTGKHAGLAPIHELRTNQGTHHERNGDRKFFLLLHRVRDGVIHLGERSTHRSVFVRTHLKEGEETKVGEVTGRRMVARRTRAAE